MSRVLVKLLLPLSMVVAALSAAAPAPAVDHAGRGPELAFAQVSAGGEYSCGIKADGSLWCWGRNTWGQIGNGKRGDDVASPTRVGSGTSWAQVSAGGATTCATRTNGTLFCWGLNNRGQIGDGTRDVTTRPTKVAGSGWRSVSTAWYNTCAIKKTGAAWCWGDNTAGQLGRGNTTATLKRVRVRGGDWRSLSVGGWFVCGTKTDSSMWCWGRNLFGQLGDGSYAGRTAPVRIGAKRAWAEVDTSWTHSCARTRGGVPFCWGRNTRGALGTGTTAASNRPVKVAGDHTATSIAAYEGGSCLVDADRRAWCWGDNLYGQVGGKQVSVPRPRQRPGEYGRLAAGWTHLCATRPGAAAVCWGNNERKQLGGRLRSRTDATFFPGDGAAERGVGPRDDLRLRIASFNVLGEHHSGAYRDADRFAPSRMRAEWTAQAILNGGIDVVGIQEPSLAQVNAIQRASNDRLAAFPDGPDKLSTETTLLWDKRRFEAVRTRAFRTQFIERKLPRPLVLLRDKETGRQFWVLAVHNAPWDYQKQRNEAVSAQLERINKIGADGTPVFYVGDFNEKKTILCKVLRQTDLATPIGGRVTKDGTCKPPRTMRVDWVFGPSDATYSGFSFSRPPLVAMSTDHYVPVTDVRVP